MRNLQMQWVRWWVEWGICAVLKSEGLGYDELLGGATSNKAVEPGFDIEYKLQL